MENTLQATFEEAVATSKTLTERPSNETLLRLYSLYKQATEGDCLTDPPANPFDFVNKAKHQAWTDLKGMDTPSAMQQYIDLIEQLKS
ncbi:MAG: acyl-CoA-binding protein [Bacteroidetes bacterium]|nr:acyl-CoA-binding protein [Bacteroidota bacterium]